MVSSLTNVTDDLQTWLQSATAAADPAGTGRQGPLRFAFYGRLSTREHQHCETSRQWQLTVATELTSGYGVVSAEFLDVGVTRRRSWQGRPQAAALLAAASEPGRVFDAVVVGEYERAFCGRQVFEVAAVLAELGVALWLPELLGPVDVDDPAHRAVLIELGARSVREVQRARRRAVEAMRAQTKRQGRYLGGRPPYGYRLVDVGPHPIASHARWGRQLQRLDLDPVTAPRVRWIFEQRLAGRSLSGIAGVLNRRGVPCPSAQDPGRNRHRRMGGWSLTTVAEILANPRYTGRQVWNRQNVRYPDGTGGAQAPRRGRNVRSEWVVSDRPAHPPLVTEEDFVAVQRVSARLQPADGTPRRYRLVGVLRCGYCGRRLESHWAHGRAWYRCRHGQLKGVPVVAGQPRALYLREDRLLDQLTAVNQGVQPDEMARHLRERGSVAVCTRGDISMERP